MKAINIIFLECHVMGWIVSGLQYVLLKGAYTDAFILHDESTNDPKLLEDMEAMKAHFGSRFLTTEEEKLPDTEINQKDNRQDLSRLWAKVFPFT